MRKTCTLCGGSLNKANKNGICQKCLSIKLDPEEAKEETLIKGYFQTAKPKNISDNGLKKYLKRKIGFDLMTARFEDTLVYLNTKIKKGVLPKQSDDLEFKNVLTGLRNRVLNEEQKIQLNLISPKILGRISRKADRERCFQEAIDFVKTFKRLPKRTKDDLKERRIANWLRDSINVEYKAQVLKLL